MQQYYVFVSRLNQKTGDGSMTSLKELWRAKIISHETPSNRRQINMGFQETLGRVQDKLPDVVPPRLAQTFPCFDTLPQISYHVYPIREPFIPTLRVFFFLLQNLRCGLSRLKFVKQTRAQSVT